jgi:predicted RNA binding protein YcfA (HicA-like mRNA interferase family)
MQRRQLLRWLRQHGATRVRHGAEHDVFRGPNGKQATVPRHREINSLTGRGICDQLGVPRPPWR